MIARLCAFLLLFGSATALSAQSYATDRGSMIVGGTAGVSASQPNGSTWYTTAIFAPSLEYFVRPGLALGGDALLYYTDTDGTAVGVGPAVSYYFGSGDHPLHPFLAASTSLTHSGSTDELDLTFRGSAGLLRMLSQSVGLDGRVYYQTGWGPTVVGLGFGFSAFVL